MPAAISSGSIPAGSDPAMGLGIAWGREDSRSEGSTRSTPQREQGSHSAVSLPPAGSIAGRDTPGEEEGGSSSRSPERAGGLPTPFGAAGGIVSARAPAGDPAPSAPGELSASLLASWRCFRLRLPEAEPLYSALRRLDSLRR
jgi:hypothetical protein